jgi:hypothetical protein
MNREEALTRRIRYMSKMEHGKWYTIREIATFAGTDETDAIRQELLTQTRKKKLIRSRQERPVKVGNYIKQYYVNVFRLPGRK